MSETKIITPTQRATRMKQLAEKVKELQQFANENQISLFVEAGALIREDADDPRDLQWNRVSTVVADCSTETVEGITDAALAGYEIDDDVREGIGQSIDWRMTAAGKAIAACDAITGLRDLKVPTVLIETLVHEPLAAMGHQLERGFAVQASVKGDTEQLRRATGGDPNMIAKAALHKASLTEDQRNMLLQTDYEQNMLVGLVRAMQHLAEKVTERADAVESGMFKAAVA